MAGAMAALQSALSADVWNSAIDVTDTQDSTDASVEWSVSCTFGAGRGSEVDVQMDDYQVTIGARWHSSMSAWQGSMSVA